jgi:hypothetical protein
MLKDKIIINGGLTALSGIMQVSVALEPYKVGFALCPENPSNSR